MCLVLSVYLPSVHMQTVIFKATTMTIREPSMKTRNGVANSVVKDFGNVEGFLVSEVQAGTMLYDVGLFIDSDTNAMGLKAHTKESYWQ